MGSMTVRFIDGRVGLRIVFERSLGVTFSGIGWTYL